MMDKIIQYQMREISTAQVAKFLDQYTESLKTKVVSGSLLSFEQCLREEFLVNTQNYPKEYHNLFHQKFKRAEKRFREQSGNDC